MGFRHPVGPLCDRSCGPWLSGKWAAFECFAVGALLTKLRAVKLPIMPESRPFRCCLTPSAQSMPCRIMRLTVRAQPHGHGSDSCPGARLRPNN
jgi:hypothetical protein